MSINFQTMRQNMLSSAMAALMICTAAMSYGHEEIAKEGDVRGRLDFEAADLPAANVEVDLNQSMFQDLFGIGDAAIAGVAESLPATPEDGDQSAQGEMVAQQLGAVRQIIQLAGNVIREIHVRVYESLPEDVGSAAALTTGFDQQLKSGGWETLAKARSDEEFVRVAAKRADGSIQGLFVVASDGDAVVLVNLVCDVSPENVKKLTSAATAIALKNGLADAIQMKFESTVVASSDEGEVTAVAAPVVTATPVIASPATPVEVR